MRRAGHVGRVGGRRVAYRALVGRPEGKGHLEDLGGDGRIRLKWNFKKRNKGRRLDRSGLGQGQVEDCCECGVEPPSSI